MDFTFSAIDMKARDKARRDFTQAPGGSDCRREFACKPLGLTLSAIFKYDGDDIAVRGRVTDTTGADRAVSLFFAVPLDGTGLVWHDDIRRSRRVAGKRLFEKTYPASCGSGAMSIYPVGTVSGKGSDGGRFCLSMALDPTLPGQFRIGYDPSRRELSIRYDFALVPDTESFPGAADFSFRVYRSSPDWGFRGAWTKYMELFPAQFAVRERKQGLWMPFTAVETVRGWKDFGFRFHEMHGTGSDFDSQNGIKAYNYTEPFTWWMNMPKGMKRTYENALAMMEKYAADDNADAFQHAHALALKASGMKTADGKYFVQFFDLPWCNGACWILNPNPNQPGEFNGATVNWNASCLAKRHGFGTQLAGEYIDSVEGYTTPELNFDRNAFKYETLPLTFDAKTKRPGIFKGVSVFEFTRKVAADMHTINKSLFGNGVPYRFSWLLANFDIMGTETVWLGKDGTYAPVKDEQMAVWRTLSGQKPYLLLQNTDFGKFDHSMVERYMQRVLFYGLQPSMFSVDAASNPYWKNPAFYDRDRDLFKKYVPLVSEVAEAGWEPVTLARSSNRNVFVERFGHRYLTLCNDTATPQKAQVTVDFPVRQQAVERISGVPVAVSDKGTISLELQSQTTALIDFEPGA